MSQLPKYVAMRGKRFRVLLPGHMLEKRYIGTYDTLEEAVRARDEKLRELGYSVPEARTDTEGNTSFRIAGNLAEVQASGLVHTLEGLLEAAQVDTEEWRVLRWGAKAYPGWAKRERSDLTWVDGAIDHGHVKKDGIETVQLWSVHATLIRRKPIPVFPTVQPVTCDRQFPPPHPPVPGSVARSLVLSDPHFWYRRDGKTLVPMHDARALDIALQVAGQVQPDRIDVLGDLLDMTDWTDRFTRVPAYSLQLQPTLVRAHQFLRALRECVPTAEIRLYEGNHEARLRRALLNHLPAAYDLQPVDEIEMELPPSLTVPRLLALHKLQIEWIGDYPDAEQGLNERVWLSHGEALSSVPGGTARAMMRGTVVTRVFGHVHRREWTTQTYWQPQRYEVESVCPGCLCHLDGRVAGTKKRQNWQQGIALIEYEPGGGGYRIELIPIDYATGRALWRGAWLEGDGTWLDTY